MNNMTNCKITRRSSLMCAAAVLISLAMNPAGAVITPAKKPVPNNCVPLGDWIVPGSGKTSQQEVIARAAKASL